MWEHSVWGEEALDLKSGFATAPVTTVNTIYVTLFLSNTSVIVMV